MESALTSVALYRRRIRASSERVWENVRDWEHLPWLHASSFRSIALEDSGDWGWRASIGLHGASSIRLELVIDGDRYVSRTLEGAGAGSEIWTTVTPHTAAETDIEVDFQLPGVEPSHAARIGDGFLRLYTSLWDEDETMMRERASRLAARGAGATAGEVGLGPLPALRESVPTRVEFAGQPFEVAWVDDAFVVYSLICPHWLGSLAGASVDSGIVTCPWHGYRFDVRTGKRCDAESKLRLAPAPRFEVRGDRGYLVPR